MRKSTAAGAAAYLTANLEQAMASSKRSLEQEWAASPTPSPTFATSLRKLECETSDCVNKTAGWPGLASLFGQKLRNSH